MRTAADTLVRDRRVFDVFRSTLLHGNTHLDGVCWVYTLPDKAHPCARAFASWGYVWYVPTSRTACHNDKTAVSIFVATCRIRDVTGIKGLLVLDGTLVNGVALSTCRRTEAVEALSTYGRTEAVFG